MFISCKFKIKVLGDLMFGGFLVELFFFLFDEGNSIGDLEVMYY